MAEYNFVDVVWCRECVHGAWCVKVCVAAVRADAGGFGRTQRERDARRRARAGRQ